MQQNAATSPPGLAKIKRVVVLMFENRSFDHIFGALPGVNGLFQNGQINQNYYNLPNPLAEPSASNLPVYPAPVDPAFPMAHDFTHDFGDGMMPDLFGPTFTIIPRQDGRAGPCDSDRHHKKPADQVHYESGYKTGGPTNQIQPPPPTYPATNSGFYTTYNACQPQGQPALTYFDDGVLKVLHTLAKNFVVCDAWHCDMPGHTLPNRAFIHCATTDGVGIDDSDGGQCTAPTIFELIDKVPITQPSAPSGWKIYDRSTTTGNLTTSTPAS